MTARNRREDLLRVADQLINCLHFSDDYNAEPGEGEILIVISTNDDYERSLFAELPTFLKEEWKRLREYDGSGDCPMCGSSDDRRFDCD